MCPRIRLCAPAARAAVGGCIAVALAHARHINSAYGPYAMFDSVTSSPCARTPVHSPPFVTAPTELLLPRSAQHQLMPHTHPTALKRHPTASDVCPAPPDIAHLPELAAFLVPGASHHCLPATSQQQSAAAAAAAACRSCGFGCNKAIPTRGYRGGRMAQSTTQRRALTVSSWMVSCDSLLRSLPLVFPRQQ